MPPSKFIVVVELGATKVQLKSRKGTMYFDNVQTAMLRGSQHAHEFLSGCGASKPRIVVQVYRVVSSSSHADVYTEAAASVI